MASIGYSGSISRHLLNRSFPIQNLQSIDPAVLADWRTQYIASNGTLNPATQQVPNPYQPRRAAAVRGPAGGADDPRVRTRCSRIRCSSARTRRSTGRARPPTITRCRCASAAAIANGLMFDAHYTWSKNIDSTDTGIEDNQGFNAGGTRATTPARPERQSAARPERRAASLRRDRSSTSCRSAKGKTLASPRPAEARSPAAGRWAAA